MKVWKLPDIQHVWDFTTVAKQFQWGNDHDEQIRSEDSGHEGLREKERGERNQSRYRIERRYKWDGITLSSLAGEEPFVHWASW